jgi:hypothetical protein
MAASFYRKSVASASDAAASAEAAETSAADSGNSAAAAAASTSSANTSANNAAASFDAFDDIYLGAKASDPSVDNDGSPLVSGQLYWDTSSNVLKVYNGTTWVAYTASPGDMLASNNLSDLDDAATARGNLGVDILAGYRNKLINGNFDIWQRGTSFTIAAGEFGYTADRWIISNTTNQSVTISRQAMTLGQTDVPGSPLQ